MALSTLAETDGGPRVRHDDSQAPAAASEASAHATLGHPIQCPLALAPNGRTVPAPRDPAPATTAVKRRWTDPRRWDMVAGSSGS